jgi:hypothetical protein
MLLLLTSLQWVAGPASFRPPASVRAEYNYLDLGTERTFFTPTARTSGKRFKLPKLA